MRTNIQHWQYTSFQKCERNSNSFQHTANNLAWFLYSIQLDSCRLYNGTFWYSGIEWAKNSLQLYTLKYTHIRYTVQVISVIIFPANILTNAKHSAFLTNHLADTDKTKRNYQEQHTKNQNHARKLLNCAQTARLKGLSHYQMPICSSGLF